MLKLRVLLLLLPLLIPLLAHANGVVVLLELEGAIGPATSDFISRGLQNAQTRGAKLIILRMDTPGGLDTSMRDIVQAILASPVPVASYVAPGGARAASAGTYILYASHIAAMAPATNLGAATPVQIGGAPTLPGGTSPEPADKEPAQDEDESEQQKQTDDTAPATAMERKLVNDASAYLRSLAQLRGRSVEWAEQAVRKGASLSAAEALEQGVIDIVATDVADLLRQLDGRVVQIAGAEHRLATAGAVLETIEPDWRNELLAMITHPQVAYILMLLGVYGLFFELSNPGAVFPGVLGGICLLLALFAFQVLPINYAGLALILLGLLFIIGEAFMPSFGALGLGGIIAFIVGSLILWDEQHVGYEVPLGIILGFALANALVFIGLGSLIIRQHKRPALSPEETLIGAIAVAGEDFDGKGRVRIHGESWQAFSDHPLKKGEQVRVAARDGLVLNVQTLDKGAQQQ